MKITKIDISNYLKINILMLIIIILNIIASDVIFRMVLNLNVMELQAYAYDKCLGLFVGGLIFLPWGYRFKKYMTLLFSFSYQFLSFYLLMKIQNDIFIILLMNNIVEFLMQVIPFILVFGFTVFILFRLDRYFSSIKLPKALGLCGILIICSAFLLYQGIYGYIAADYAKTSEKRHPGYVEKYRHSLDDYEVVEKLGLFRYEKTLIENYQYSLKAHEIDEKSLEEAKQFMNDNLYQGNVNEYSGTMAGKNLIMILCESLDDSIVNEQLMPNVYKLTQNSLSFENHYAPLLKYHTSDSEFISQTGMFPSQQFGSTYMNFANNAYPYSLGNLFKAQGYQTNAFHSFYEYFYNRDVMYDSLGIDHFYGARELGLTVDKNDLTGLNGFYKDEELIKDMFRVTDLENPFYNVFLSLSGHSAYRENRPDIQEKLAIVNSLEEYKDYPMEAKCYIAAQMLFDDAIGYLLSELENKGILDDTVICLFSDHYPYGMGDEEAMGYIVDDSLPYSQHHVLSLIYNPELPAQKITNITSTFDIYPTIANLFRLDISGAYVIGDDILSSNPRYVLFENGDVLNDNFYYSVSDNAVYDNNMQIVSSYDEAFSDAMDEAKNILAYAQDVLRGDLYN
ncbi:MAG: LTA synthase family protein [Erysipelotrichaceae bacterium]|nr:LTA synthase family protein [Erysipelotrichaceae bacterium]MDY5252768.1 LTA synthase family protein [Erysipelotrichaceae bacterium]